MGAPIGLPGHNRDFAETALAIPDRFGGPAVCAARGGHNRKNTILRSRYCFQPPGFRRLFVEFVLAASMALLGVTFHRLRRVELYQKYPQAARYKSFGKGDV